MSGGSARHAGARRLRAAPARAAKLQACVSGRRASAGRCAQRKWVHLELQQRVWYEPPPTLLKKQLLQAQGGGVACQSSVQRRDAQ